jgi:hypothetical protein
MGRAHLKFKNDLYIVKLASILYEHVLACSCMQTTAELQTPTFCQHTQPSGLLSSQGRKEKE